MTHMTSDPSAARQAQVADLSRPVEFGLSIALRQNFGADLRSRILARNVTLVSIRENLWNGSSGGGYRTASRKYPA